MKPRAQRREIQFAKKLAEMRTGWKDGYRDLGGSVAFDEWCCWCDVYGYPHISDVADSVSTFLPANVLDLTVGGHWIVRNGLGPWRERRIAWINVTGDV